MLPITQLPSPNFASRNGATVSMLVLHYTGMRSAKEALDRLCLAEAQVSSHYVVDEDGSIYQLVDEANTAWHAGVSFWRGQKNVNPVSIGIEIVNPGHEFGYRPFPIAQMQAVSELCKSIITRHAISAVNVVGHSDIAPLRKEDPGELFDWKWLAAQGVGAWPEMLVSKNQNPKAMLAEYGYEPAENEAHLHKIIAAFQRHFRTSRMNGEWDDECNQLLAALLQMV